MSDIVKKFKPASMDEILFLAMPSLKEGKGVKFTVVGHSMYPIFRSNIDNVTVKAAGKVKRLDVILYRRGDGSFVLHRVVGKGKLGYKLCGDDQVVIEYPVAEEAVVAVMTSFERNGREYDARCLWYRLYSFFWCLCIPLRPFEFKIAKKIKYLFKGCK